MRHESRWWLTGLAAVTLVGVTACSSSSKSSSSSGSTAHAGSSTGSSTASGTPLKVVYINDAGQQTGTDDGEGIKVGVAAINATGGVDGHPIQVTTCTDNDDPNQAATCARNAVSSSAIAVVGNGTSYGSGVDPILEAAGMASIGNSTFTAADFDCSVCFNDSAGDFGSIGSALAAAKLTGAKRIGIPYINVPAGATLAPLVNSLIKPLGASAVGVIPVNVTATDLTPQAAAEGAAKPDAIIDGLTTELFSSFIHSYRSQGFTTPILVSGGVYDANGISSQLSGVNSNIDVVAEFNYNSPGYQNFMSDFNKYGGGYSNHDDEVLRGWFAVKEFAYAAQHAQSDTRAGILAEMKSLSDYNSDGLLPPLNYTQPQTGLGGHAPTVYADTIWLWSYSNGKLSPIGNGVGVNVFTGATVSS
jgi:branched-chain amino acid transport system substrate-binding protein